MKDLAERISEFRRLRLKRGMAGLEGDEAAKLILLTNDLDQEAPDLHHDWELKHDLELVAEEVRELKGAPKE